MARVDYSDEALSDLEQIGDYIADELQNPQAVLHTVTMIQDRIDKLADFPFIGAPLSSIVDVDTDYRFLVCGSYLAFYRPVENLVLIDRVLYGRRDYLAILFGDISEE